MRGSTKAKLWAYTRKTLAEGKPHRVALNAVANKRCHVVYACLLDRRPYEAPRPRSQGGVGPQELRGRPAPAENRGSASTRNAVEPAPAHPDRPADVVDGVRLGMVQREGLGPLLLVELPAPSALLAAGPGRVEPGPGPRADELPPNTARAATTWKTSLSRWPSCRCALEAAEPALPPAAARCRLPQNNLYILSNELLSSWWIEPGRFSAPRPSYTLSETVLSKIISHPLLSERLAF